MKGPSTVLNREDDNSNNNNNNNNNNNRKNNSTSNRDDDERINFTSEKFDAEYALLFYHGPIETPAQRRSIEYAVYDHIGKCKQFLDLAHEDFEDIAQPRHRTSLEQKQKRERLKAKAVKFKEEAEEFERREHAIDQIARTLNKGPFSLLHRAMKKGVRVKIVTRHANGIRGCMECFVRAFDKFMNVIVFDCEETYTVRVLKQKEYVNKEGSTKTRRVRELENRERRVSQMFLRGEHVVLISSLDEEEDGEDDDCDDCDDDDDEEDIGTAVENEEEEDDDDWGDETVRVVPK